jgi:hypothetical protein
VPAKAGIATQQDLLMGIISQNAIKHILLSYQGGISGKSGRAGRLFMQNKANLRKRQMNISVFTIKDYENEPAFGIPKSKPKQTQFQNAIWFKMGKNKRESVLGLIDFAQHEVSALLLFEAKAEVARLQRRTCLTRRKKSLVKSMNGGYKEHLVI